MELLSSDLFLCPPPVFQEFIKLTNHDVEHAIRKRMSGDVRDAFLAIGQCPEGAPSGQGSPEGCSPFTCLCQGNVTADSCCLWAMDAHSVAWDEGVLWGQACTLVPRKACS